jgi:hypothetical protein
VFLAIVTLVVAYFGPFLIACWRRHPRRWLMFLVNVFGASGIAWVAALVIALWRFPPGPPGEARRAAAPASPGRLAHQPRRLGLDDPGHPVEPQNER